MLFNSSCLIALGPLLRFEVKMPVQDCVACKVSELCHYWACIQLVGHSVNLQCLIQALCSFAQLLHQFCVPSSLTQLMEQASLASWQPCMQSEYPS